MSSSSGWSRMRALLLAEYDILVEKFTRRLGSKDLANEAVHEAFLRIERGGDIGDVARPRAYLYQMTANIAADRRKAERLRAAPAEGDTLDEVPDPAPGPEQHAAAAQRMALVRRALDQMPRRRREIASAMWFEDLTTKEIAARFKVSERTVQSETRAALMHCAEALKRGILRDKKS